MKKRILIAFAVLLLVGGCKTKEVIRYVEIPKVITKIDSVTILRTDSFLEIRRGDTIYQQRWKTLYSEKIKIQKDTVSIPVEVIKDKIVKVEVVKYKHDLLWWIGLVCFGLVIGYVGTKIYKFIK